MITGVASIDTAQLVAPSHPAIKRNEVRAVCRMRFNRMYTVWVGDGVRAGCDAKFRQKLVQTHANLRVGYVEIGFNANDFASASL